MNIRYTFTWNLILEFPKKPILISIIGDIDWLLIVLQPDSA